MVSSATGSGNPYEELYRALFWAGMLLALVTALQLAALSFFMWKRSRRPPLVAFPRPQLFVVMLGMPALIAAAAGAPQSGTLLTSRCSQVVIIGGCSVCTSCSLHVVMLGMPALTVAAAGAPRNGTLFAI